MTPKTYAVDIIGQKEPTYILESDVVKLVRNANSGARLVMVGKTFINPASVARIRRAYGLDISQIEATDHELVDKIEDKQLKQIR